MFLRHSFYFILQKEKNYVKLILLFEYDPLVKWLNTPPSQGGIHGFETHTGYQRK